MNLEHKWLGDDLLVFKNQNDCMTINRGHFSIARIDRIELNGEDLYLGDDIYDFEDHPDNPFTKEEIKYWLEYYEENV